MCLYIYLYVCIYTCIYSFIYSFIYLVMEFDRSPFSFRRGEFSSIRKLPNSFGKHVSQKINHLCILL